MFSHIVLGTDDIEASKRFYDAVLATLGVAAGAGDEGGRVVYANDRGLFMLTRPIDGRAACHANGGTIGFYAFSPAQVDAFHAAGLAHGGVACEDPPGVRTLRDGRRLYLAYLRDPAGNKIVATHPMPA